MRSPESLLPRTRAAVGCGHCQRLGAHQSCPTCGRPVCGGCRARRLVCPSPRPRALRLGLWRVVDVDEGENLALLRNTWLDRHALLDLERGEIVERLRADLAGPRLSGTRWREPSVLDRLDDVVERVRDPSDAVLCRDVCYINDLLVLGLGGGLLIAQLSQARVQVRITLPEVVWVRIAGDHVFALDASSNVWVLAIDRRLHPRAWRRHCLSFAEGNVRSGVLGARFRVALEEAGRLLALGAPDGVDVVLDPRGSRQRQRLPFRPPSLLRVLSRRRLLLAAGGSELRIWPFDTSPEISGQRPSTFRL
ncbi:MAG: hypothetical protein KC503_41740 [Myxococcales bacterium]|nr:hypothetical protein [Myxococcales bacterium]